MRLLEEREAERIRSLLVVLKTLLAKCEQGADCFDAGAEAGKALVDLGKPATIGLTAVVDPEWISIFVTCRYIDLMRDLMRDRDLEFEQECDELCGRLWSLPWEAMLGLTAGARTSGLGTDLYDVPDDEANSGMLNAVEPSARRA